MLTKELMVDFDGFVTARDGLRVIADRYVKGKHFILLGAGQDVNLVGFDRLYPPLVRDVSHPSDSKKNLRIFSAVVKQLASPRNCKILASPRVHEADGEDVLFRVLMKHPKTPPLIYACELSDKTTVVAEGVVRDFDGTVYYDRLLILPKGEQLRLTTKAGDWLIANHGAGVVQVAQIRRGLGDSPLKKGLEKKLAEGQLGKAGNKADKKKFKAVAPATVIGKAPIDAQVVVPETPANSSIGMMSLDWESEGFGSVFSGK